MRRIGPLVVLLALVVIAILWLRVVSAGGADLEPNSGEGAARTDIVPATASLGNSRDPLQ